MGTAATGTKIEARPIKVLIADDDAPTRILLRAAISQWGYEVLEAADGEEAWTLLQNPDAPKLMIVDWLMPKLDGIDLCRRIKNESKHHPYIILLTQLTGTTNIVKGLEAGANEFLSKPFNMAELQSRLSVGKRIISFEESITKKNQELKAYFVEMKELSDTLHQVSKKIDDIIQNSQTNNAVLQTELLKDLQAYTKQIVQRMNAISEEHQSSGGQNV